MYFDTKNYFKSTRNYTAKHAQNLSFFVLWIRRPGSTLSFFSNVERLKLKS